MSKSYAYRVIIGGQVYVYSYSDEPVNEKPEICMTSPKKDIYRLTLDGLQGSTCSCPAFVYRKNPNAPCKHIQAVCAKDRSHITPPS